MGEGVETLYMRKEVISRGSDRDVYDNEGCGQDMFRAEWTGGHNLRVKKNKKHES